MSTINNKEAKKIENESPLKWQKSQKLQSPHLPAQAHIREDSALRNLPNTICIKKNSTFNTRLNKRIGNKE